MANRDFTVKSLEEIIGTIPTYTQTYDTASRTIAAPTGVTMGDLVSTTGGWGSSTEAGFDKITTAVDQLIADNLNLRQVITGLIDDLQAYGFVI